MTDAQTEAQLREDMKVMDLKWSGSVSVSSFEHEHVHIDVCGRWEDAKLGIDGTLSSEDAETIHQIVYQTLGNDGARDFDDAQKLEAHLTSECQKLSKIDIANTDLSCSTFCPPKLLEEKTFSVDVKPQWRGAKVAIGESSHEGSQREIPELTSLTFVRPEALWKLETSGDGTYTLLARPYYDVGGSELETVGWERGMIHQILQQELEESDLWEIGWVSWPSGVVTEPGPLLNSLSRSLRGNAILEKIGQDISDRGPSQEWLEIGQSTFSPLSAPC